MADEDILEIPDEVVEPMTPPEASEEEI